MWHASNPNYPVNQGRIDPWASYDNQVNKGIYPTQNLESVPIPSSLDGKSYCFNGGPFGNE